MVTTFLLDFDFRKSAQHLDRLRCGKQRVEAMQILNFCNDLRILAKICNFLYKKTGLYKNIENLPNEIKTSVEFRQKWIDDIFDILKNYGYKNINIKNGYISVDYLAGKNKNDYLTNEYIEELKDLNIKITKQFRNHPAVRMWLGYENCLKDYINAHIEIWIERGYKNTMKLYDIVEYKRPYWCDDIKIINNFKKMLVKREIERSEELWYCLKHDFLYLYITNKFPNNDDNLSKKLHNYLMTLPKKTWFENLSPSVLIEYGSSPDYIWP